MYEEYTDKQIIEMLKPKLAKLGWGNVVDDIDLFPETYKMIATIYRSAYVRGQLGRSFIIGEKAKELVSTFKMGDKVKFLGFSIDDEEALSNRRFYPPVGTIGEVVELSPNCCIVQWPHGLTSGDGLWACFSKYLKKVEEKWVPATMDNVKIGDKVKIIDNKTICSQRWYPLIGTIGVVKENCDLNCFVQWPKGSTSNDDKWYCNYNRLEVLKCE